MIVFNGQALPTGVEVINIEKPLQAPIEINKIDIAGRNGKYNLNKKFKEREIMIEMKITGTSYTDFSDKIRDVIDFLNTSEPKQLYFLNDTDYYYLAIVEDVIPIEEISTTSGTIQVTFVCSDPFKYKVATQTPVTLNTDSTATTVTNEGDLDCYPLFEVEVDNDCTFIGLANNTTGEQMIVGSPVVVGETPYNLQTTVFTGSLSSLSEMTQVTELTTGYLDSGDITATHEVRTTTIAGSSQSGYGVAQGDYGVVTGGGWHGAVSEKILATAQDNFSITWDLQLNTGNNATTTSMSELYIYDDSIPRQRLAKLTFADWNNGVTNPQLYLKIYDGTGITDSDVLYSGTTSVLSTFDESKARNTAYYYNPTGLIRIRVARRSDVWKVWVAYINPTDGDFEEVMRQDLFQWEDVNGVLTSFDLEQVYFSTLVYGNTAEPVEQICHTLRIYEEDVDSTGTPYIFEDGDKVIIDSNKGQILKNGVPFFEFLDPTSDFPKLLKGDNEVIVVGDKGRFINAQLIKNERYL